MQSATRWVPVALWMGAIFAASSIHGSSIPGGWSVEGHVVEYAILGALVARAAWGRGSSGRTLALAVMIASLYGITDELHQALVPGRMPDPMDWAVDTIAGAIGAAAFAWIALRVASRIADSQ